MPDQASGVVSELAFKSASRRLEGREKVLGQSKYVGDLTDLDLALELDVAVVVTSSQATGSVLSISAGAGACQPGRKGGPDARERSSTSQGPFAQRNGDRDDSPVAGCEAALRR